MVSLISIAHVLTCRIEGKLAPVMGPLQKLGSGLGSMGRAGNNLLQGTRRLLQLKSKDKQL